MPSSERDFRSYPAQKHPPVPRSTATRASSSASNSRNSRTRSPAVSTSTAFRTSGRLIVTVVIGPLLSTTTFIALAIALVLLAHTGRDRSTAVPLAHGLLEAHLFGPLFEPPSFRRVPADPVEER